MTGSCQGFSMSQGRRHDSAGCAYNFYGDVAVKLVFGFPHIGKATVAQPRYEFNLQSKIILHRAITVQMSDSRDLLSE